MLLACEVIILKPKSGNHAHENPRQRQAAILEYLQKQGKCSVEELAQYFDTTGTTIRKDLVILEHAGTVIRTYGGVVLNKEESDPPIDHKTLINTHKKELIAEAAVSFIHDGDSIILDAGSTVFADGSPCSRALITSR